MNGNSRNHITVLIYAELEKILNIDTYHSSIGVSAILTPPQAICVARGYSLDELETMRAKKADERGGFKDKVFLEYVE